MCNLYRMTASVDEIARLFGQLSGAPQNLPSYPEIYPNREAPIVRREGGELLLERLTWGVPLPANPKRPVTNVRNLSSNFWRSMLTDPERRCLVPVTQFCEWEGEPGSKRKVWFATADEGLFAFAGIWRPTPQGPRFAFLTTEPNETVGAVHPKAMPVILAPGGYETWLAGPWEEAQQLVAPYPDEGMAAPERGA